MPSSLDYPSSHAKNGSSASPFSDQLHPNSTPHFRSMIWLAGCQLSSLNGVLSSPLSDMLAKSRQVVRFRGPMCVGVLEYLALPPAQDIRIKRDPGALFWVWAPAWAMSLCCWAWFLVSAGPVTSKDVSAHLRSLALPSPLCRTEVKANASQAFLAGSDGTAQALLSFRR